MFEVYNADVTSFEGIAPASIDLTVTSPPYNAGIKYNSYNDNLPYTGYLDFSEAWLKRVLYWSKPDGRLCLNLPIDIETSEGKKPIYSDVLNIALAAGWKYKTYIAWDKRAKAQFNNAWGSWMSASAPNVTPYLELIAVLYKDTWKKQRKGESDISKYEFMDWVKGIWDISTIQKTNHPAPFPIELPRRCIKLFSFVGDTVLDPFCGSGTTLAAGVNHRRQAIGIDIDAGYCALARLVAAVHSWQQGGLGLDFGEDDSKVVSYD